MSKNSVTKSEEKACYELSDTIYEMALSADNIKFLLGELMNEMFTDETAPDQDTVLLHYERAKMFFGIAFDYVKSLTDKLHDLDEITYPNK